MYTLLYLKWITKKDLPYSMWNSVQCYVAAWIGEGFGGSLDTFVAGRGPLPGPKSSLRNELSKETHVLTKQEILLGRGTQAESSRVREPRRTALPHGSQSRVLW